MGQFNFAEIKRIDIIGFLAQIGIRPVHNYPDYALYHAPYREDNHPSFKVSRKKNRWYDLATMASGDIIDLGKLIYDTNNIVDVINKLQSHTAVCLVLKRSAMHTATAEDMGNIRRLVAHPLTNPRLLSYLDTRKIDLDVARQYCQEVHYVMGCKTYYAIGMRNVKGGYEVRNSFFKGCVGPKDVSLITTGEHNEYCTMFEGFMDFLSYITLARRSQFEMFMEQSMDFLVLNSVANLQKAMPWIERYQVITCCLDNDDAGRRAVDALGEAREGVHDVSDAYEGFKDLNDFLRGKRFCP